MADESLLNNASIILDKKSSSLPSCLIESKHRTTQLVFNVKDGRTVTRLRRPRDLYALSKSSFQTIPRWPAELEVVCDRPAHTLYLPSLPEPLSNRETDVKIFKKPSNIRGRVVYDNTPDLENKYFLTSKVERSSPHHRSPTCLTDSNNNTLLFESRFESGNLKKAIKVGEYAYELWLKFDLYTAKHTQWFYFQLSNAKPNVTYTFTIMNLLKSGSLYNSGLKPLIYSRRDAKERGVGWRRVGSNIVYYKNNIKVNENKERCYYSLQWTCSFTNENDTYYFAHSFPYTYSDLQAYLTFLSTDLKRRKTCKQRVLCETLAGNHVYVLTITSANTCPKQAKKKKAIVISARVHPGETVSSWMMKGLLDFLTSGHPDAKVLRDLFVFKVVPMLNPDGVIVGNYRCSLSGRDLNRNYGTVLQDFFPPVWTLKCLVKKLQEEREVAMFCDLHGHSRKKDIFVYGCERRGEIESSIRSRIFPAMLSRNAPDKFSYKACRFSVQRHKEGTGRVVMWNSNVENSYTLEASFCGSSVTECHFSIKDYESMGYHFCDTLLDYFDPNPAKYEMIHSEIELQLREDALRRSLEGGLHMDATSDDSFGSDSSVSDGLPMQLLYAPPIEITKKKRLRTRKERNANIYTSLPKFSSENITMVHNENRGKITTKRVHPQNNAKKKKIMFNQKRMRKSSSLTERTMNQNDVPSNRRKEQGKLKSVSSCTNCNPSYYLSLDATDDIPKEHRCNSANYSLFEVRLPSKQQHVINPTLDLARQITVFNYLSGKAPPRRSKMFSVWTNEGQGKREELLKRKCLNQGDNIDSDIRRKLSSLSLKPYEAMSQDEGGQDDVENPRTFLETKSFLPKIDNFTLVADGLRQNDVTDPQAIASSSVLSCEAIAPVMSGGLVEHSCTFSKDYEGLCFRRFSSLNYPINSCVKKKEPARPHVPQLTNKKTAVEDVANEVRPRDAPPRYQ